LEEKSKLLLKKPHLLFRMKTMVEFIDEQNKLNGDDMHGEWL